MLIAVQVLVGEEHDLVVQDGGLDLVTHGAAERMAEVHALDLRADRGLERPDGDGALLHARLGNRGHHDFLKSIKLIDKMHFRWRFDMSQ